MVAAELLDEIVVNRLAKWEGGMGGPDRRTTLKTKGAAD